MHVAQVCQTRYIINTLFETFLFFQHIFIITHSNISSQSKNTSISLIMYEHISHIRAEGTTITHNMHSYGFSIKEFQTHFFCFPQSLSFVYLRITFLIKQKITLIHDSYPSIMNLIKKSLLPTLHKTLLRKIYIYQKFVFVKICAYSRCFEIASYTFVNSYH